MAFCQNCGAKLEHGDAFCPNCGTKTATPASASAPQPVRPACSTSAAGEYGATGGLKVWLWILIVCGIFSILYNLFQAYAVGRFKVAFTLDAIILAIELYGEALMLKAYKRGFYILVICACVGVVVSAFSATRVLGLAISLILSAGGALVSIGLLWLFTKQQWPRFR